MPRTTDPADPLTVPDHIRALPTHSLASAMHERGRCAGALVTGAPEADLWHPTTGCGYELQAGAYARQARLACGGCPVTTECLEWALRRESDHGTGRPQGIYGGLSPAERHRLVVAARTPAPSQPGPVARHGAGHGRTAGCTGTASAAY